jgi:hypothetical protein
MVAKASLEKHFRSFSHFITEDVGDREEERLKGLRSPFWFAGVPVVRGQFSVDTAIA